MDLVLRNVLTDVKVTALVPDYVTYGSSDELNGDFSTFSLYTFDD